MIWLASTTERLQALSGGGQPDHPVGGGDAAAEVAIRCRQLLTVAAAESLVADQVVAASVDGAAEGNCSGGTQVGFGSGSRPVLQ